tara:strand:- start:24 stop:527 length:504 start_codon:yes stop_codon:yes gene_type:complete
MVIELLNPQTYHENLDSIFKLNQENIPEVGELLSLQNLAQLIGLSSFIYISRFNDSIAGFIILMREGVDYKSENYKYFKSKYKRFLYIDRIVIDQDFRKKGIGSSFYNLAIQNAIENNLFLCCEVNQQPPNEVSMSFHKKFNFKEVGLGIQVKGKREVVYMEKSFEE